MPQDVIGQALQDFHAAGAAEDITVHCSDFDTDIIPVGHFFRPFEEMPSLEQHALKHCKGRVLDVGAGAGSHALWLQNQGHAVTTLDISTGAVHVQQARGIEHPLLGNIHDPTVQTRLAQTPFDTLLLLMNGIGIAGTLTGLNDFLQQAKKWLKPDGSILLDSSDLIFLHEEEDGAISLCLTAQYYGELTYQMQYKSLQTEKFPWLFVDFTTLSDHADAQGFTAELVAEGDHYDYLAKLSLTKR
jgi:SAM-dependent methyltransferase